MKTIELTTEERQAFETMFVENDLADYLSYSESGTLCEDAYSSLFRKLGIALTVENSVDLGEEDV